MDSKDILRSLAEALEVLSPAKLEFLAGYAEGIIAGSNSRPQQDMRERT